MSKGNLEKALEYLEAGWSIIPLSSVEKHPLVKWKKYQQEHPTTDDLERWWETWPDADLGIVTGAISGLCVVDADNAASVERAELEGYISPHSSEDQAWVALLFCSSNGRSNPWPKIRYQ